MTTKEGNKTSGMIEGGGEFIDYRDPNKIFRTKNPQEWEEHLKKTGATYSGTAPCAMCSKAVDFKDLKYGIKPLCDSCKGEVSKR